MHTASIISKALDKRGQRLLIGVEFTDGVTVHTMSLPFAPTASFEDIKRRIKSLVDELDQAVVEVDSIVEGAVDLDTLPELPDIERNKWFGNYSRLEQIQKLIDLGVLTGSEPKVVALRAKVTSDFKPEYLNLI